MAKSFVVDYGPYRIPFEIEGDSDYGGDYVLLDRDDDLTAGQPWADVGYTVAPFLDEDDFRRLKEGITQLLSTFVEEESGTSLHGEFRLEHYHRWVGDNEALHMAIVSRFRSCLPIDQCPIDVERIVDRISMICGKSLTLQGNHPEIWPMFCIRVVRPQSTDNNPLHRDVWLDRLRNCVNIYSPMAGSTENSSLPMVPGSHRWRESEIERTAEGALVDGRSFTVPAVVGARRPIEIVRPNPGENEVLVFSPYLIHGGGINRNNDLTRVSLEMRFWRAH